MERKIREQFIYNSLDVSGSGSLLEVVEQSGCDDCFFLRTGGCERYSAHVDFNSDSAGVCSSRLRSDGNSIIFKDIKVGEILEII